MRFLLTWEGPFVADSTEALAKSLHALSGFLVGEETPRAALLRIAQLGEAAVPGAEATGLTLVDENGRAQTAVFTSEKAPEVDQVQYDEGDGPCLHAYQQRVPVRIDSNHTDSRWPSFSAQAADRGVLSSLSIPLMIEDRPLGAINFYGFVEGAFSEADEGVASGFAAQAAIVVANAQAYWGAHARSLNLDEAMRSRAVIEQAKGIIMARSGMSPEGAFDVLVRASQQENRKLRAIAAELVDRAQRPAAQREDEALG